MNATHWHLVLNHVPVLAAPFGLAVLVWGMLRGSMDLKKLSLVVFVAAALIGWPTYQTGEEAGMEIANGTDLMIGFIALHENAAQLGFGALAVLGAISLAALIIWRGSQALPMWFTWFMLLATTAVSALLGQTAYFGGQIGHEEIRTEATKAAALQQARKMAE